MPFSTLLLLALGAVIRAGVTREDLPGVYRPTRVKKRQALGLDLCPQLITLGEISTVGNDTSAPISTDAEGCKATNLVLKEHGPEANGTVTLPAMARRIREKHAKQSGTIVTGTLTGRVSCRDIGNRRNRLRTGKPVTFVRPLGAFLEFGTTFQKGSVYALLRKANQRCIYIQDEKPLVSNPVAPEQNAGDSPAHKHPPGTPGHTHATGTVKIALWAWLGPLIGGLTVCILLLICVLWRYRKERWYPFNGNQHEDASDSEMFGRLSNQSPYKGGSNSFERAPSGIVFENSNDDGSDPSDSTRNNNGNGNNNNNMRI